MKPVTIEVITYAPTVFYHCQHCELTFQEMGIGEKLRREEAAAALPDDLARDFQALSDWVHRLLERFGTGRPKCNCRSCAGLPEMKEERAGPNGDKQNCRDDRERKVTFDGIGHTLGGNIA